MSTTGGLSLKHPRIALMLALLASSVALMAQTTPFTADLPAQSAPAYDARNVTAGRSTKRTRAVPAPFSRVALGGGISAMGVHMEIATNANRYMNLRVVGNLFSYNMNNLSTNGFLVNGKLNLATAGASVDFYPFPMHGFRVSPGLLFLNNNGANANMIAQGATSFTLDDATYYSSVSDPVKGYGNVTLNNQNPAFTITTGWGNTISRRGGHWSLPVEIGVALISDPVVNIVLNGGQVCSNPEGTENCEDVVGNSSVDSNLKAQIVKYNNDLQPLRFYPILSFGVAYNFRIR
jgi:hypothetical protein